jgi:hypothetical protein
MTLYIGEHPDAELPMRYLSLPGVSIAVGGEWSRDACGRCGRPRSHHAWILYAFSSLRDTPLDCSLRPRVVGGDT